MRARALQFDGSTTEVPAEQSLARATTGTPVIVEGLLREVGYLEPLTRMYEDSVREIAGADAASRVHAVGLERIHEVCPPDLVAAILVDLDQRARSYTLPLARAVVERIGPERGDRYYVGNRMWVRAMVPNALLAPHPELVEARYLAGHLYALERHTDADLTHPYSSVVVWCAVRPVSEGNTIALYGDGDVPFTPALEPGDALMFNTDDPHATVVNDTDETRISLAFRLVPSRRLRYGRGHHWRPYTYVGLLDTPLAPLATLRSRCTRAAWRRWRWRRRWEREQLRTTGTLPALTKR